LRLDELMDNGSFVPSLRLYSPGGALFRTVSGTATATISVTATNSGRFIVIVSDGNGGLFGSGTYRLTSNGLSDEFRLCIPIISGTNAYLGAVGGTTNAPFRLYTTTNLATSFALWTPILTNQFDGLGTFLHTNPFSKLETQRFFWLSEP